jgi:hypothetical protein
MDNPLPPTPAPLDRPPFLPILVLFCILAAIGLATWAVIIGLDRGLILLGLSLVMLTAAYGLWRQQAWARLLTIGLLLVGMFAVGVGMAAPEQSHIPVADIISLLTVCPLLALQGALLYWLVSHDNAFC